VPVLVRNTFAFFVAVAIYVGSFLVYRYIFSLFGYHIFDALILFQCAFGVVGYLLFSGNSRAVLVLFATLISEIALNTVMLDPIVAPDPRHAYVQTFVWASMAMLSAIATNITGWVSEWIHVRRFGPPMAEENESERIAKNKTTLAYRLGKLVGHLRSNLRR
jgi:hypothetical protein